MKKLLILVLTLCTMALLLAGCGCEHEWMAATCTTPKTCMLCDKTDGEPAGHQAGDWVVTLEPVEGKAGQRSQLCASCAEPLSTEEYLLSSTHDGTNFTLTVEEISSRLNGILGQVRPGISCRIEDNRIGNPAIYVYWQEEAYLTAISPKTEDEKDITDVHTCPGRLMNITQLDTTHQTKGDNPIAVFELQIDVMQAMIMACDPQISGADARQLVMDFLESGEMYVFDQSGTLVCYFFLSNLGQPLLSLTLYPV